MKRRQFAPDAAIALASFGLARAALAATPSEGRSEIQNMRRETLCQLTENGLALQATLQGTKYYKNDDLN